MFCFVSDGNSFIRLSECRVQSQVFISSSFGHACDKTDHVIARKIERVLSEMVFSFCALMLFTTFLDWVLVWLFYQTPFGDLTLCSLFFLLSCNVTDKWMSTSRMFWRLGWGNHSCCSIWLKKNSVSCWKWFIFIWMKRNLLFNVFWSPILSAIFYYCCSWGIGQLL